MQYTVSVEGLIGAGKSTFLKCFDPAKFKVFPEPISAWQNYAGGKYDFLKLLYENPKKYSPSFQSAVLYTMLESHTKPILQPFRLLERSVFSGRDVFMKRAKVLSHIDPVQFQVLDDWYDLIIDHFKLRLDLVIYLRATPAVALERVRVRARDGESGLNLEMMQQLENLHETWLGSLPSDCEVIHVDADATPSEMKEKAVSIQEHIWNKYK